MPTSAPDADMITRVPSPGTEIPFTARSHCTTRRSATLLMIGVPRGRVRRREARWRSARLRSAALLSTVPPSGTSARAKSRSAPPSVLCSVRSATPLVLTRRCSIRSSPDSSVIRSPGSARRPAVLSGSRSAAATLEIGGRFAAASRAGTTYVRSGASALLGAAQAAAMRSGRSAAVRRMHGELDTSRYPRL